MFGLKELLTQTSSESKSREIADKFVTGGLAGVTSMCLLYPLEVIRTRFAVRNNGFYNFAMVSYKLHGIQGFYKGMGISLLGAGVHRALWFGLFDNGKTLLFPDSRNANFLPIFALAQISTIIASTIAYPIDTIRRRLIIISHDKSAWSCLRFLVNS